MNLRGMPTCTTVIALAFAVTATFIDWLVLGATSPLRQYFMYHVRLPNFVGNLLILPYVVLIVFRPRPPFEEIIGFAMEFLQWLIVGWVLGWLICRGR